MMELALCMEEVVQRFSMWNKFTLGSELCLKPVICLCGFKVNMVGRIRETGFYCLVVNNVKDLGDMPLVLFMEYNVRG